MAFGDTARRLAATLLAMLHTRIELASVELQEESQRLIGYLVLGLAALFLAGLSVLLLVFLVIVLFWDSHRIEAVTALTVLCGLGTVFVAVTLRSQLRKRPPLMGATVCELKKDLETLRWHHE